MAARNMLASLSFLFCTLISTKAVDDLRATNPFLDVSDASAVSDFVVAVIFHASRVGQVITSGWKPPDSTDSELPPDKSPPDRLLIASPNRPFQ